MTAAEADWTIDPVIADAVARRLSQPLTYDPPYTAGPVGEALAEHYADRHGLAVTGANFWLTSGVVSALSGVLRRLLRPGESALYFSPSYHSLPDAIEAVGARAVAVELDVFDAPERALERLAECVTPTTRVILLCNPHNPTGHVFSRSELERIAEVARERDLVVVSNELHARVVLRGTPHTPMHAVYPERTLVLGGATKSHNLAAIGGGFVTAHDADWLHAIRRQVGPEVAPARGVQQAAMRAAYSGPDSQWLTDARRRLSWSAEVLQDALTARFPHWRVHRPDATAFLWIEGQRSRDAAAQLEQACGIRGLSGREFRADARYLRLAHGLGRAVLDDALQAITAREG
jgi:cysteine-S-conjugate beta-lyase